ncbi:hypothetical protein C8R47DRAFT_1329374 [Mycena vitilis]|nr:hypothetical protein C8R47DRAFT_1329374 [Mycena vitilis]
MTEQSPIRGLVCVDLEPGPDIAEANLDAIDWYPSTVTAARYKAADSKPPTWLTLYDVESVDIPTEYVLSESEREPGSLRHRLYALLSTAADAQKSGEDLPGKYVLAVSFEIAPENEEDFNRWYDEEHMAMVARIPGWRRGRRYKLVKCQHIRGPIMADEPVSRYLTLHELDNGDFDRSAEIKNARSTEWAQRVFKSAIRREVRTFELHKVLERPEE